MRSQRRNRRQNDNLVTDNQWNGEWGVGNGEYGFPFSSCPFVSPSHCLPIPLSVCLRRWQRGKRNVVQSAIRNYDQSFVGELRGGRIENHRAQAFRGFG